MLKSLIASCLVLCAVPAALADTKKTSHQQAEADRLFKSGVALFKEGKFSEALAEFERAYEIAPHPLVLYNIAACHRELSHYADAVKYYGRFLEEGKGKVPASRLSTAQTELDAILARIARVTVSFSPSDGATLIIDGTPLGTLLDMPLVLPPGEHRLVARAPGRQDVERTIRVASGDSLTIELTLPELPPPEKQTVVVEKIVAPPPPPRPRHFDLGAGFGTNLRRVADSGAPSIGFSYVIGTRLELGVDAILVAFSVMPSVRVKLAGDALAVHAVAALPISFTDGNMTQTFVAGAAGLGVRYHATPQLAFRLETFVSFAGAAHGMTLPTFVGGELWF